MMEQVVYGDLTFVKYIHQTEISVRVKEIAQEITLNHSEQNPVFVVILNGAFMFAADLLREIHFKHEVLFVEAKSYIGLTSSGEVHFDKNKLDKLSGRNVIIIEDIVDSGKTLSEFILTLHQKNVLSIDIATLLLKPTALQYDVISRYVGFEIPNLFVVGYGLDYNDMGRSLPHIYQLLPQFIQ